MNANSRYPLLAAIVLFPLLAACAATSMTGSAPVRFNGDRLVDNAGMTLYSYDKDAGGKSACTGACAGNWPPLKAAAADTARGDFSVIARDDGSRQWAYDGKPLYYWSKDAKPGDATGDNFNKVWHVVNKAGPMEQPGGSDY